jgi:hypothetical protein
MMQKVREMEELRQNRIMSRGMKTMIIFNKNL